VTYRTTIGWSLITSGILTIALTQIPYDSFYWGIAFIVVGLVVFVSRRIV
jgi:hypothetical protein